MRPNFQERKKKMAAKTNFGRFVSLKINGCSLSYDKQKKQANLS